MAKRKATASRKIAGQRSSSRPSKRRKAAVEQPPPQIKAPLPLRMYNPNEVPPPLVEEPLEVALST